MTLGDMTASPFPVLFSPLRIGPIEIANRIVMAPHFTGFADGSPRVGEPGYYGERYADYLVERARGGVGLIIFGQVQVHPSTAYELPHAAIGYDAAAVPGYRAATRRIHAAGAKVFVQLAHSGLSNEGGPERLAVLGPSDGIGWIIAEAGRAMEIEEIHDLVETYGRAAEFAREGGFDGIEIHCTHGYLPLQFLSPRFNRRTDRYGGSLENRMRFLVDILDRVGRVTGTDLVLGVRLCADEFTDGGLTLDDTKEVAARLSASGKVHYLSVSLGHAATSMPMVIAPMYVPPAYGVYAAAAIRSVVNVPVFTVGRITDPATAERILADGQADAVALARGLIADPEWAAKARAGRADEIRVCTANNKCLLGRPLRCIQNPAVGKEREWGVGTLQRPARRRRALVVGGGVAGMEAARVAAERGHEVILCEQANELGGQVTLAHRLPGRQEMAGLIRWPEGQLKTLGVKIFLGHTVTAPAVREFAPDAVVIATGSIADRRGATLYRAAGIDGWEDAPILTPEEVIRGGAALGKRVVIFDDVGEIESLGIAEMVAAEGREVELITTLPFAGMRVDGSTLPLVLARIPSVRTTPLSEVAAMRDRTVVVRGLISRAQRQIPEVDALVIITRRQRQAGLYDILKGQVAELYCIGDAVAPRGVDHAVYDGHRVGRSL